MDYLLCLLIGFAVVVGVITVALKWLDDDPVQMITSHRKRKSKR